MQKSVEPEKKGMTPEPTARTALILQEKVETGSVSAWIDSLRIGSDCSALLVLRFVFR